MSALLCIRTLDDIRLNPHAFQSSKFDVFGFILFHSQHRHLRSFLFKNQSWLDQCSGETVLLFSVMKPNVDFERIVAGSLPRDHVIMRGSSDSKIKELDGSTLRTHSEYNEDESLGIAAELGIPRDSLPCIVFFKNISKVINKKELQSFATLSLDDKNFATESLLELQLDFLAAFFDGIEEVIGTNGFNSLDDNQLKIELDRMLARTITRKTLENKIGPGLLNVAISIARIPFLLLANIDKLLMKIAENKFTTDEKK